MLGKASVIQTIYGLHFVVSETIFRDIIVSNDVAVKPSSKCV